MEGSIVHVHSLLKIVSVLFVCLFVFNATIVHFVCHERLSKGTVPLKFVFHMDICIYMNCLVISEYGK